MGQIPNPQFLWCIILIKIWLCINLHSPFIKISKDYWFFKILIPKFENTLSSLFFYSKAHAWLLIKRGRPEYIPPLPPCLRGCRKGWSIAAIKMIAFSSFEIAALFPLPCLLFLAFKELLRGTYRNSAFWWMRGVQDNILAIIGYRLGQFWKSCWFVNIWKN